MVTDPPTMGQRKLAPREAPPVDHDLRGDPSGADDWGHLHLHVDSAPPRKSRTPESRPASTDYKPKLVEQDGRFVAIEETVMTILMTKKAKGKAVAVPEWLRIAITHQITKSGAKRVRGLATLYVVAAQMLWHYYDPKTQELRYKGSSVSPSTQTARASYGSTPASSPRKYTSPGMRCSGRRTVSTICTSSR